MHPHKTGPSPCLSDGASDAPVSIASAARRRILTAGGSIALASALPGLARAQSDWPSKPIRLVVPFPAGGGADMGARAIAVHMGNAFGKPVLVENRAGADGAVAALEVPSLKKSPPYDPVADFTPISNLCIFTFYLMVPASMPVNTLAEFVAYTKANPGKVIYATGNSTGIVSMAALIQANKLDMTHVPYKGEAQAVIDLVGGRVQAMFVTPAVMPQLLKEKFKPLAVLLPERTRAFPDVPTMAEAGQPLVNIRPWGGLFGPARLPRELVDRISKDTNVVMRRPDVVEQYDKLGLLPTPSSPEAMGTLVKEQLALWTRTMRAAGIEQE